MHVFRDEYAMGEGIAPYLVLYCQLQYLFERVYGILPSHWVPFCVPYMCVRRKHDSYRIFGICLTEFRQDPSTLRSYSLLAK